MTDMNGQTTSPLEQGQIGYVPMTDLAIRDGHSPYGLPIRRSGNGDLEIDLNQEQDEWILHLVTFLRTNLHDLQACKEQSAEQLKQMKELREILESYVNASAAHSVGSVQQRDRTGRISDGVTTEDLDTINRGVGHIDINKIDMVDPSQAAHEDSEEAQCPSTSSLNLSTAAISCVGHGSDQSLREDLATLQADVELYQYQSYKRYKRIVGLLEMANELLKSFGSAINVSQQRLEKLAYMLVNIMQDNDEDRARQRKIDLEIRTLESNYTTLARCLEDETTERRLEIYRLEKLAGAHTATYEAHVQQALERQGEGFRHHVTQSCSQLQEQVRTKCDEDRQRDNTAVKEDIRLQCNELRTELQRYQTSYTEQNIHRSEEALTTKLDEINRKIDQLCSGVVPSGLSKAIDQVDRRVSAEGSIMRSSIEQTFIDSKTYYDEEIRKLRADIQQLNQEAATSDSDNMSGIINTVPIPSHVSGHAVRFGEEESAIRPQVDQNFIVAKKQHDHELAELRAQIRQLEEITQMDQGLVVTRTQHEVDVANLHVWITQLEERAEKTQVDQGLVVSRTQNETDMAELRVRIEQLEDVVAAGGNVNGRESSPKAPESRSDTEHPATISSGSSDGTGHAAINYPQISNGTEQASFDSSESSGSSNRTNHGDTSALQGGKPSTQTTTSTRSKRPFSSTDEESQPKGVKRIRDRFNYRPGAGVRHCAYRRLGGICTAFFWSSAERPEDEVWQWCAEHAYIGSRFDMLGR
ncbi:MAG: hypothetical protein Q9166_006730 [cf. Caloplaca sp. 2 TL-2023]